MNKNTILIVILSLVVLLAFVVLGGLYWTTRKEASVLNEQQQGAETQTATTTDQGADAQISTGEADQSTGAAVVEDLGSQIFEKTNNPISGELPEENAAAPAVNPLEGVYENPFE